MPGVLSSIRNARNTARCFAALRQAACSDTCVIVGNGPSLRVETVAAIDVGAADVFISNFAFEHAELFERAQVLGIVNPLVVEQAVGGLSHVYFNSRVAGKKAPLLLLPENLAELIVENVNAVGVATAATPGFQAHPALGASNQSTVTYFLLQVAFWVGYKHVTLIGVDNSYDQPDVKEGVVINQVDADANHFSSDYFRGRRWQAANTQRMAAVIAMAAAAYTQHGRLLTNSTVGGALEVLPRVSLTDVLERATPGATSLELSRARSFLLSKWALLLRLRSRWLLGFVLFAAAALSLVSVVSRTAASSFALVEFAPLGAGFCVLLAAIIVAVGLRARNSELSSQRTFERLSREAGARPATKPKIP